MKSYDVTHRFSYVPRTEDDPDTEGGLLHLCDDCLTFSDADTEGRVFGQELDDVCDHCGVNGQGLTPDELDALDDEEDEDLAA